MVTQVSPQAVKDALEHNPHVREYCWLALITMECVQMYRKLLKLFIEQVSFAGG